MLAISKKRAATEKVSRLMSGHSTKKHSITNYDGGTLKKTVRDLPNANLPVGQLGFELIAMFTKMKSARTYQKLDFSQILEMMTRLENTNTIPTKILRYTGPAKQNRRNSKLTQYRCICTKE